MSDRSNPLSSPSFPPSDEPPTRPRRPEGPRSLDAAARSQRSSELHTQERHQPQRGALVKTTTEDHPPSDGAHVQAVALRPVIRAFEKPHHPLFSCPTVRARPVRFQSEPLHRYAERAHFRTSRARSESPLEAVQVTAPPLPTPSARTISCLSHPHRRTRASAPITGCPRASSLSGFTAASTRDQQLRNAPFSQAHAKGFLVNTGIRVEESCADPNGGHASQEHSSPANVRACVRTSTSRSRITRVTSSTSRGAPASRATTRTYITRTLSPAGQRIQRRRERSGEQ